MSPPEPKREEPVEKQIRGDREKAHQHRCIAFADGVKRRRQHFQGRIRNETNRVKLQCTGSLPRHFRCKPPVLINHANDRRRQHGESDRRRNREQKGQPHSARKNRAELCGVP